MLVMFEPFKRNSLCLLGRENAIAEYLTHKQLDV